MIIGQRKKTNTTQSVGTVSCEKLYLLYFVSTVSMSVGNLNRYILFTHPQYNIASILPRGIM